VGWLYCNSEVGLLPCWTDHLSSYFIGQSLNPIDHSAAVTGNSMVWFSASPNCNLEMTTLCYASYNSQDLIDPRWKHKTKNWQWSWTRDSRYPLSCYCEINWLMPSSFVSSDVTDATSLTIQSVPPEFASFNLTLDSYACLNLFEMYSNWSNQLQYNFV
jgi:hypothetical protein